MYRPVLAVAAVVLVLTLVGTTGAQKNSGGGLPKQICKLKTNKTKCQELRAKGRCTDDDIFKRCQRVCDPRCQLGKPKPKCADTESASFCKQKKNSNKCNQTEARKKCKKTCGKCSACDNRVEEAVCNLVSALGWCKETKLFELCRETCDPRCKEATCNDCNDTCVGDVAVIKKCSARGVCLLDNIIPCENRCQGDNVIMRVCEDGRCVRDGLKKCTDKCYGNTLVSVNCENGKCVYGKSKECTCGCDKSGTKCVDTTSCCTTTCAKDDVLQNPNSAKCRCRECINDKGGLTTDTGCNKNMPLCGAPRRRYGDECFMCQNDKDEGKGDDTGCGGNKPNCRANPGEYGKECFGTVCKLKDLDVCISVDGSGSLDANEFAVERKFVNDLVSGFANVPDATVQWGGNQFGASVADIIGGFVDGSAFTAAVNGMSQVGGGTNMGAGVLNCSTKLASTASTSKNKLFILITDGANNVGYTNAQVQGFASNLKNSAQILTVGAGTDGSTDAFLKSMATDDTLFFEASSVTDINVVLQEIITRLCETTEVV